VTRREPHRILICDDNPDILELLRMVLEGEGYLVRAVASGREVVERIRKEQVDLLLLDLRMPDLDGFAVMDRMRGMGIPPPPVVVLSAKGLDEDREAAFRAGAREFLTKPFHVDGLLDAVQRHLQPEEEQDSK
jgi:two-component system OmpR family response regulator